MTDRERALYMISTVAELLGIHPQTLRLYEREGFIKPKRTGGGVRVYSDDDVEKIRLVMNLTRELGVNLAGVEVILSMREKIETLQMEMERMAEAVRREFIAEQSRKPKGKVVKIKIEKK